MSIFALIDCNNFYASCERVFNPSLGNKPIVVLSNNDGCIIARSNEAKKLKIPMGVPYFQWKVFLEQHKVYVFSSNYSLYGDMSKRVMTVIKQFCPEMEIYSIDEAFVSLTQYQAHDLKLFAIEMQRAIKMNTGIPVSIGIAPTKTLAKIANQIAKKHTSDGIFDLRNNLLREKILSEFPIEDIWGIGYQLTQKLHHFNIKTAKDLRDADLKTLRKRFSVVMEKIIQELRCISCLPLEEIQPRKQIMSSRSFGKPITELKDMEEAISVYTSSACLKLRKQNSYANGIYVFLKTNDLKSSCYTVYTFPEPTCDTSYIIKIAKFCLNKIFKPDIRYNKSGVMLLDVSPQTVLQFDLFSKENTTNKDNLIKTIDLINEKMGKRTLYYCAEGINHKWKLKSHKKSPRYTTQWNEIPYVNCGWIKNE